MINRFVGEYFYLNNFYSSGFHYKDMYYPTVEHFFQSRKTTDSIVSEAIRTAATPYQAAYLGRNCQLKPNWEHIKIRIMRMALVLKFQQHQYLKGFLLSTGKQELIHGNKHNDTFWGVCNGYGQNKLGILLMELREKFQNEIDNPKQTQLTLKKFALRLRRHGCLVEGIDPMEYVKLNKERLESFCENSISTVVSFRTTDF